MGTDNGGSIQYGYTLEAIHSLWGTDNGGSIQYGYTFEILNTFKMGHLKKSCSHLPSRMDPSQTPGMTSHFPETSSHITRLHSEHNDHINIPHHLRRTSREGEKKSTQKHPSPYRKATPSCFPAPRHRELTST